MFSNITFIHGFILKKYSLIHDCFLLLKSHLFMSLILKVWFFFEKVVFQNKLKIYLVVALDRVVLQCSVKCIEKLSGHENIVSNIRVVTEWLCHWMQVPLYMWLKSLSVTQLRLLSIALKTMDRGLSNDSCLNPILCHVCVENYAYQRMRLWRVDSRPSTGSLLTLYTVFNILYTIKYICLRSLSVQQHKFLFVALNTTQGCKPWLVFKFLCVPCMGRELCLPGMNLEKGIVTHGQGAYWPCTYYLIFFILSTIFILGPCP